MPDFTASDSGRLLLRSDHSSYSIISFGMGVGCWDVNFDMWAGVLVSETGMTIERDGQWCFGSSRSASEGGRKELLQI